MPAARRRTRSTRSGGRPPTAGPRGEEGGGPISTWIGFLVFLSLLLFAVQALFNLYAASVVTAVAYDAARQVAGAGGGLARAPGAEADARRALGRYGARVTFDWSASGGEAVVLRVQARNPHVLLPALAGPLAFDQLDRTVRVRTETFR